MTLGQGLSRRRAPGTRLRPRPTSPNSVLISPRGIRTSTRLSGEDLRRPAVPTPIIWGERDPVVPLAQARAVAAEIPHAHREALPTGHVSQLGNPDRVAAPIGDPHSVTPQGRCPADPHPRSRFGLRYAPTHPGGCTLMPRSARVMPVCGRSQSLTTRDTAQTYSEFMPSRAHRLLVCEDDDLTVREDRND